MYENDKYIGDLTEAQRSSLETVLNLQRPLLSQMALSLLKRDNPDYNFSEVILIPSLNPSRKSKPDKTIVELDKESIMKLYPNPAFDYITIDYTTSGIFYNNLWLEIFDSQGRKVLTKHLKGGDNEELIGLGELSHGTYVVSLFADGRIIESEKLNIEK